MTKLASTITFLILLLSSASVVHASTVTWNANPEPDIAGYILSRSDTTGVCVGDVPVASATSLNVGNVTSVLLALTPGAQYFFVVQAYNTSGLISPCSAEVAFTVSAGAPTFTTQPSGQTVTAGQNTSFTVAANGTPLPSLQWQISVNNGVNWTNLANTAPYSNVTTATLTVTGATGGLSGAQYRAVATNSAGTAPSNPATLTVNVLIAPTITTQPSSQTVAAAGSTSFTVVANGFPAPTYQWQISTNGSGGPWTNLTNTAPYSNVTTATLSLTSISGTLNGAQYRSVVTNSAGQAISNGALLTVTVLPTITTQPTSQTVTAGQNTSFTVAASGNPTPTYQWQRSIDGGASWTNLTNAAPYSGATTTILALTNVTAPLSGNRYRAVATSGVGSVNSNAATLTVNVAPTITTQPANQTVLAGQNASFTVAATGTPTPTYQWQISTTGGGGPWTNLTNTAPYSNATTGTLTITNAAAGLNAAQYRAVATNSIGSSASNAATLTVDLAPAITTQPSDQVVTIGQNASFTIAANGIPAPTYQWQISTTGGGGPWTNLTSAAPYSGVTTATLSLTNVAAGLNGARYRCVATNSTGTATSNAALLTVNIGAPVFTTHPASQLVTVGQTAQFTAAAVGTPAPTHQWQISTNGGVNWTNLTNASPYSGATTTTLTVASVTAGLDGAMYRSVASNTLGSVVSNAATLTVNVPPTITSQPTGQTVTVGQNISFTVAASGSPAPTYQWQVSDDGGASFANLTNTPPYSGVTTVTLALTNVPAAFNGHQFRVVAINVAATATSNAAALTVLIPPTITAQPADRMVAVGQNATFTMAAGGNPSPTYQWQVCLDGATCDSGGGTWTSLTNAPPYSGVTTTTLILTNATSALDGYRYRSVAANSAGTEASNAAVLTVIVPPAITTAPANQAVIAGQPASFTVVASGTAPTYQWQASTDFGVTWTDLTNASATTPTLTLTATTWWNFVVFRCVASNFGGSATSNSALLTVYGAVTVSPASLTFSATKTAASATLTNLTPPQSTMTVGFTGASIDWTATTSETWIQITNGFGNGGGQFTVEIVNPGNFIGASTILNGSITVTATSSSNWPVVIPVTLLVTQTLNAAPIGSFDTPAAGTTGLQGSIALGGWALAPSVNDSVDRVEIWRDPVAGDTTPPSQGAGPANGKIFVANAPLIDGARPDVEAQFTGEPQAARAGWGALVLTRGLSSQGDGTYTLYAIAYDTAGRSAILGTTTITVDNANAIQPFGTLDTPGEGATVSGTLSISGWALTSGSACTISPTGVWASIDSGTLVPVLYGLARPDIAFAFPGFTNSDFAGGSISLDTTTLTNGAHQISWSVTDDCGRQAWIGTRFFTVFNGGAATAAGPVPPAALSPVTVNWDPVLVYWGQAPSSLAYPNADGVRIIQLAERNRIEVQLPALGGATYSGYHTVGDLSRALPLGSSLDGQTFSWEPAAGFLGSYDLVFMATVTDGTVHAVLVRVVVGPSVRLWIDAPSSDADIAQPFDLSGWALDLAAADGTGIQTVQVRARPATGGLLVLVGIAVVDEAWPVVAAMYGGQFMNSGFRIAVNALPPGTYDLIVSAYATPYGPLSGTRTIRVTVH